MLPVIPWMNTTGSGPLYSSLEEDSAGVSASSFTGSLPQAEISGMARIKRAMIASSARRSQ